MTRHPGPPVHPSRRQLVTAGAATAGLALLGRDQTVVAAANVKEQPNRPRPLRVAHLTDMHVQPELRAGEGYAAALRSLKTLDPVPDLILTGGDHIMDAFEKDAKRAKTQWDLYEQVLAANTKLPVYPVMGNHDVWGWGQPGQIQPDAAGYGKAMAIDRLGMNGNRSYYSFDRGGWHFVCLDNIVRRGTGYYGGLDDPQAEWLIADLKANAAAGGGGKPVCVASHIPLLAACVFFDGDDRVRADFWHVPDAWMHRDVKPLLDLLRRGNVKLCLSGHIHLVDRVDYLGMTFLCNGAVSGGWWKGPNQEFAEGYGVLDLWPDGTFRHDYVTYGWKADA